MKSQFRELKYYERIIFSAQGESNDDDGDSLGHNLLRMARSPMLSLDQSQDGGSASIGMPSDQAIRTSSKNLLS